MTYNLKKDFGKNWDLPQINEKSMIIIENDDDQDIYISERSSIASSLDDIEQAPSSFIIKRLPTPTPSPPLFLPQKQSHTLRNNHHDLPENGISIPYQNHHKHKEDKTKKKTVRKGPSSQKNASLFPETKLSESSDNHYPHWYYHHGKNHDVLVRHRQTNDNQVIPSEAIDPSQYIYQTALTPSTIKPRQQQSRKTRPNGVPIPPSNQDKQRHDRTEKHSSSVSHDNYDNNHQQQPQRRSSSRQHAVLKDMNNDEHREHPTKQTISQNRRKTKTENEPTDHHIHTRSGNSPQDPNTLIITSTSLTNRSKQRSKVTEKNSLNSDGDEIIKHRNHHHHQNQTQTHNSPSIPSQQNHHHHPSHLHVRRRPPSGAYLGPEIQVVDVTFKKPERTTYFQQVRDPFLSPTPSTHNQTPHLPPIIRDYHHRTSTTRFPTEYYGTLARQTQGKDWEETIEIPKIYKPDVPTRFYDRYLNTVVDKRLAA